MDITPLIAEGKKIITGYGDGVFFINKEPIQGNIIVLPGIVIPWQVTSLETITIDSLAVLLEYEIEILLIGSGNVHFSPNFALKHALKQKGINVDSMSTGAACRTYNVLLSEDRRVAAALMTIR